MTQFHVGVRRCGAGRRFGNLSTCVRPYLGWLRCSSDDDRDDSVPLASAARRFAVSRRLRDWSELVEQLDASCPTGDYHNKSLQ